MVGEIRDPETAQIAIQSALTGHLVFTTVHANNVFDVVSRFCTWSGTYSFVSALSGVLAQRLIRVICVRAARVYATQGTDRSVGTVSRGLSRFQISQRPGLASTAGHRLPGRKAVGELLVTER